MAKIIYTHTDEAPLLATYSFLPDHRGVRRGRPAWRSRRATSPSPGAIIAAVPRAAHRRAAPRRRPRRARRAGHDARGQHHQAAQHLAPRSRSSRPPSPSCRRRATTCPTTPRTRRPTRSATTRARYDKVKGSAVNPVLREGNSDRRAPASVKNYAKAHPHSMGAWSSDSKTNVATMGHDDFRSNEKSVVLEADDTLRIEHVAADGTDTVLKERPAGARRRGRRRHLHERRAPCDASSTEQVARAKAEDVLFSVHLKATMMKVSDPIIFGHVVQAFFPDALRAVRRAARRARASRANDGLGALARRPSTSSPDGDGDQGRHRAGPRRRPGAGDGRLRQGHHQPARARPTSSSTPRCPR